MADETKKEIEITVRGGVVQDISGIPEDVIVKLVDYDNEPDDQVSYWDGDDYYA